jgi:hypothetical protein
LPRISIKKNEPYYVSPYNYEGVSKGGKFCLTKSLKSRTSLGLETYTSAAKATD